MIVAGKTSKFTISCTKWKEDNEIETLFIPK